MGSNIIIKANNLSREFKIAKKESNIIKRVLFRSYKRINAVSGLNFEIKEGEFVAFIGPNGAGKSTTIKMMTGILAPTDGEINVMGRSPQKHRKQNAFELGVVFGQRSQLWWDLPISDTFSLLKEIYKIPDDVYHENIKIFKDILGLEEFYDQPVRQLSLGQRMRAEISASLLHNPKVLFLDEPTIGLDVVAKKMIREFLLEINRTKKVTIILTTHDMRDITELCERIIMINDGRLFVDTSINDFKNSIDSLQYIVVEYQNISNSYDCKCTNIEEVDGNRVKYSYNPSEINSGEIISIISSKNKINDISITSPDMEDIVREIYMSKRIIKENLHKK